MEEFKKELKELLIKHDALIFVSQDEDDSFLYLQIQVGNKTEDIDTGYRDLLINADKL